MVTKNFKNILAMALESGNNMGCLKCTAVTGVIGYLSGNFGFPASPTTTLTNNDSAAGISVGTGTTAATEDDYNLEDTLTSGVNLTLTGTEYGADSPWYPYVQYSITITNTGSSTVTVTEIGYKQTVGLKKTIGSTVAAANSVVLIDRTVLDSPVTISPGDAGIVTYKLRTNPYPTPSVVAGIPMVGFSWGTDAQIAAILDAAAAGTINLQTDAGWKIGDQRLIQVAAHVAGNSVAQPAQSIPIDITSFDEYEGCGNKLQFDFAASLSALVRMNSSNTTTGGYGASEMFTTTLPALVNALPEWLRTRLKTFDVQGTAGGYSTTLTTISGNKLALRSAYEVFGSGQNGLAQEGTPVPYYVNQVNYRIKSQGINGSASSWWERSPSGAASFCNVGSGGTADNGGASAARGVAPFGCI